MNRRHETGTATAFIVVIAVTLVASAGLALDGARLLGARRNAQLVAAGAARTGSQWFNETALNNATLELDPETALTEIHNVLEQQGFDAAHRRVSYLGVRLRWNFSIQ